MAVGVKNRKLCEGGKSCGSLLVSSGIVDENYVEAMVRVTKELGPYSVIAPGIALPHARPEDGARSWNKHGDTKHGCPLWPPNDLVRVVIAFAASDKKSHLSMLRELAELLAD